MKIESNILQSTNKPDQVAVMLIDVQKSLLNGVENRIELLDAINILIRSTKILNLPLFVTEQVPQKLGPTDPALLPILSHIQPVAKTSFSIFGCAEIREKLEKEKIAHLILSGLETPICIYLSAIDAIKAGMEVTLLSDCVGARRTIDAAITFAKLQNAGCHIIPLESFLFGYLGSSEHSQFKDISNLVRSRK
ncbi:MAG: isochorismatase family protein [Opitutales bacterium]|nr:isochorismatase family protein [Opitutales bacterium]